MTTENTEKDQELDDVTLEMNANGEQLIVEELPLEEQLAQDLAREKELKALGLNILRFNDEDVKKNMEEVLKTIETWIINFKK